jgi:proteasome lid subunit RPN8/RPN11
LSDVKTSHWITPESPVAIEYSPVVIEEIRHEVAEGFQRLSRGGLEVGGVLYGTREGRTVRIQAMRPMQCEHARGPAFLLSDKDRVGLTEQLASEDPRLEGLIPVGWYLSHTRSEIALSEADVEVYSSYFPAPWQVTLVIRPGRGGSMRAGFFVREADGTVKSERSYLEFNFPDRLAGVLDRTPRAERPTTERMGGFHRSSQPPTAAPPTMPAPRETERTPAPTYEGPEFLPSPPPTRKWPWVALVLLAVAVVGAVGARYYLTGPTVEPIALNVDERDGQLRIEWNRNAKSVANATRGALEIVDGTEKKNIPLSPAELRGGKFTWERKSGEVEVRLSVENADGVKAQEASRYLGRAPQKVDTSELAAIKAKRDELEAEVERLRTENGKQTERIQQLERTLRILQARLGIDTGKQ